MACLTVALTSGATRPQADGAGRGVFGGAEPAESSGGHCPACPVLAGPWSDAALAEHHGARVAQALARRLAAAMRERGVSANRLAADSGVNRQTIANVLAGATWPDLLTIAGLEAALDADLWPGRRP